MQWKHAALGALLAGGAYLGVEALRGAPESDVVQTAADPAPVPEAVLAADQVVDAAEVAESPVADDDALTEIEGRLAAAEADRDRLRLELDRAAAERDALADELAAREAEATSAAAPDAALPTASEPKAADAPPMPSTEVVKLLADLAAQAAEIDRLKTELGARDAELVALRETAEVLPVAPETPGMVLVVAPVPADGADAPDLDAGAVADAVFAARLEAAKSGVPLPRPDSPPLSVAATRGSTPAATAPLALVLFERGSANLTAGGADRAAAAAAALATLDAGRIRVTGHSDTTGSPDANMRLSRARAEAVAAALVAAGMPADAIEIAPHGQAPDALPIPTPVGVAEPLNRCAGIFVLASAEQSPPAR